MLYEFCTPTLSNYIVHFWLLGVKLGDQLRNDLRDRQVYVKGLWVISLIYGCTNEFSSK